MRPGFRAKVFRQREAVRHLRARLDTHAVCCHHCQRPLQRDVLFTPDYAYVHRGWPFCVGCLPIVSQIRFAEAPPEALPKSSLEHQQALLTHQKLHFFYRRQHRRLKRHLLFLDPACSNCRCPLTEDSAEIVACRLSCRSCEKVVKAAAKQRTPPRERHEPTPDEIAAECEKIQAEWTPGVRRERAGLNCRGGWSSQKR